MSALGRTDYCPFGSSSEQQLLKNKSVSVGAKVETLIAHINFHEKNQKTDKKRDRDNL